MFKLTLATLASLASLTGCARVVTVGPFDHVPDLGPGDQLNVTDVDQAYCDLHGGRFEPGDAVCIDIDF